MSQQPQEQQQPDSVVRAVIERFLSRAEFGQRKYGTNLDRSDLNVMDWIQHAQEELMDGILYLEKLKKELSAPQSQIRIKTD